MMSFRLGHGVCGWPTGFYWQRSPLAGTIWVFELTGTWVGIGGPRELWGVWWSLLLSVSHLA